MSWGVVHLSGTLSAKITRKQMSMHATEILVRSHPNCTNGSTRLWVKHNAETPYSRFLKFDPAKIKYMEVQALPLRPDLAKVGVEIRVVGYAHLFIWTNP
jgi:hypothetical protein